MRIIPTRIHGYLDYATGALLILAPWLFGFANNAAETWVPVLLGAGAIGYSLLTAYELGAVPLLPMPAHLALDAGSGLFLALSPWLFGFINTQPANGWVPHVAVGLFEIGVAALTQTAPGRARYGAGAPAAGGPAL